VQLARSDRILKLIALFRWSKAVVLIAAAFGAMRLFRPGAADALVQWALQLPFAGQHRFVTRAIHQITQLDTSRMEWLVAGLLAYAALFTTEGFGLWFGKRWGEWLTIIATSSFIPFEIYELWRRATLFRAGFLVANIVIVIYLVWIRIHSVEDRHSCRSPSRPRTGKSAWSSTEFAARPRCEALITLLLRRLRG
jgi:uncharacterized membrane protein (DUF2068 family)